MRHGLYTFTRTLGTWVDISMNFVLGMPMSNKGKDSIFVVVDRFFKITHFISCNKINDTINITNLFFKEIARLHCVFKSIVSNQNIQFLFIFRRCYREK